MIIALLSDIHANHFALQAVLNDAQQQGCATIWNLGDTLGYGPCPEEVVTWQRTVDKAVSVLGNYDRKVLRFGQRPSKWPRPKSPAKFFAFQWAYEQLSEINRTYLANLPGEARLDIAGHRILLNHASPEDDQEHINHETPPHRLEYLASVAGADVVLFGHTHQQFDQTVQGVRFINPGSVGRCDDGDPRAAYAVLSLENANLRIEFRRVEYDCAAVAQDARDKGLPEAFAQMFLQGRNLNAVIGNLHPPAEKNPKSLERASLLPAVEQLARACHFEEAHARRVTHLALRLFDELQPLHGLGNDARLLLEAAGLLHDIGWIEGQQKHHKVSRDLILTAAQLPLNRRQRSMVAQIARYHRKALPSETHAGFGALQSGDQNTVGFLAGMLRVADGLDRSHTNAITEIACDVKKHSIVLHARARGNAKVEKKAAAKKADLLEQVFLRSVRIVIDVEKHADETK